MGGFYLRHNNQKCSNFTRRECSYNELHLQSFSLFFFIIKIVYKTEEKKNVESTTSSM